MNEVAFMLNPKKIPGALKLSGDYRKNPLNQ
jgi:hypothetical protein